jgi:hypothetical protein
MSYLCYLCLFGSSLPPVVCRRAHVLFMLFVFVWFVQYYSCSILIKCYDFSKEKLYSRSGTSLDQYGS